MLQTTLNSELHKEIGEARGDFNARMAVQKNFVFLQAVVIRNAVNNGAVLVLTA
jgi:hypothetical protein